MQKRIDQLKFNESAMKEKNVQMGINSKEIIKMITKVGMVYIVGQMEKSSKVIMSLILGVVMEKTHGKMGKAIKGCGVTGNGMVRVK